MKNTTQGFTLIELLIVIAIIGILAAVLIPNVLGAQDRAKDTAATACARDLVNQAAAYQADTNGYTGFAGTGDYAPGQACDTKQVKSWAVATADQNNVAGTVTSLSKKATVINWDNASVKKAQ